MEEEQGHPVKAAKVDDGVQDGAVVALEPGLARLAHIWRAMAVACPSFVARPGSVLRSLCS